MTDSRIPIEDDEMLYRRVSVRSGWFENAQLSPQAFHPNRRDESGISVFRARFRSIEDAGSGPSPDGYYVAVLNAGALRAAGIQVEPQPNVEGGVDISHAELPQINTSTTKSAEVITLKAVLVEQAMKRPIEGPFFGETP